MTVAARRATLLLAALAVLSLALLTGLTAPARSGAAASPGAHAAKKLKACKKGKNTRKCRCPKGQKLTRAGKKYRCKKKSTPGSTQGTIPGGGTTQPPGGGTTQPPGGGTTEPPGGGTTQPPAGGTEQGVRNDAAFEQALTSTLLRRYEEGSYGYGRYAYNFLSDHQFLYCSYYYAGSTVEANRVGTWHVEEGYTLASTPGYTVGKVRVTGSGFDVYVVVEMLNGQSTVKTGSASNTFTEGSFSRRAGQAVTNCSAIE
jgi:hypothetical protein